MGEYCYKVLFHETTWQNAKSECERDNAMLFVPEQMMTLNLIKSLFLRRYSYTSSGVAHIGVIYDNQKLIVIQTNTTDINTLPRILDSSSLYTLCEFTFRQHYARLMSSPNISEIEKNQLKNEQTGCAYVDFRSEYTLSILCDEIPCNRLATVICQKVPIRKKRVIVAQCLSSCIVFYNLELIQYFCETPSHISFEDKQPDSSNLQGLENDQPIPQGEPDEIINFNSDNRILTVEHQPTGEIIKEKSDIYRLQDEYFRSCVHDIQLGKHHKTDDSTKHHHEECISEYDPVVHPDSKPGRLNLSIRYDDERSQLIIQIINAQGIIRPEQVTARDMCLTFSLIENDINEHDVEKHKRFISENAPILWKEPVIFCITYEKVIKKKLYIFVSNHSDPSTPRDREILIPLHNLKNHAIETNNWFDLQYVKSTS
ncbi:unnamed protein product [Rotaria sp. Silwood1]|nr:unnamed protein product [Rotaria sp. Silwood1]CAF1648790.1 unnamed protein product [Rotaria sp. Silwood1]